MRLDKLALTAQEAFQGAMGVASDAEAAVIEGTQYYQKIQGHCSWKSYSGFWNH